MSTFAVTVDVGSPDRRAFRTVEVLVDTGSTFMWAPRSLLETLGHQPTGKELFETATGEIIERELAEVPVRINGEVRTAICVFGDEGSQAVLGAVTLEEFLLAPDPVHKRLVKVRGLAMLATRGKNHRHALGLVERSRLYSPQEALRLAREAAYAKFDESVELHLRTGLDPRHADQQLRATVLLPHGLGKSMRVLVFAEGEAAQLVQAAGADYVGADDLVKQIEGGWLEFDVALAQREVMGKVSKLGRILGPRGLMPNPKSNTILDPQDLPQAVQEAKQGRVEFRVDRTALLHMPIGKLSFGEEKLLENLAAAVEAVVKAKPSGAKGQYIKAASLCTTLGPGIKLELQPTLALARS